MDTLSFRLPNDHPLGAIMRCHLSLLGEPIRQVRILSIRRYEDPSLGEGFWVEAELVDGGSSS